MRYGTSKHKFKTIKEVAICYYLLKQGKTAQR